MTSLTARQYETVQVRRRRPVPCSHARTVVPVKSLVAESGVNVCWDMADRHASTVSLSMISPIPSTVVSDFKHTVHIYYKYLKNLLQVNIFIVFNNDFFKFQF